MSDAALLAHAVIIKLPRRRERGIRYRAELEREALKKEELKRSFFLKE
jgi:hypothetical protein